MSVDPSKSTVDFAAVLETATTPIAKNKHQAQTERMNFRHVDTLDRVVPHDESAPAEVASAQPEEQDIFSQILHALCAPFRWIGALASLIGRFFGLSS